MCSDIAIADFALVLNSLNIGLYTSDGIYSNQTVFNQTSTEIFSGSVARNDVRCSFISLPGAEYYITATQTGNLIYAYRFDGTGNGFSTRAGACGASTGGPVYYSFWNNPSANNTVIYTNIGMSSVLAGGNLWFPATYGDYVAIGSPPSFRKGDGFSIGMVNVKKYDSSVDQYVPYLELQKTLDLPQLDVALSDTNFNVDVRPLWGDTDICQLGITRVDFDLTKFANIVIKPYAVFMGSILSTTDDDALSVACRPKNDTGNLCELITGPGQILSIRQTIYSDELGRPTLEQYEFEDKGRIIDENGAFVASVPMNLNYIVTNEFGDQVFSNDPSKGIPTKGKYRFKWINRRSCLESSSKFRKC